MAIAKARKLGNFDGQTDQEFEEIRGRLNDGLESVNSIVAAKLILQEAVAGLTAAQSLGLLATGLLKNTVTAGVGLLSKAVAGTDYQAPIDYILLQDAKASGTNGGTFTSGAWRTRTINTEVIDTGNHASINANQITLAAGTYRCYIRCPAFAVLGHQAKLQNITAGATTILGSSAYSYSGYSQEDSFIKGQFTIAVSTVFEIQHRCYSNNNDDGFGIAYNFGEGEIYVTAEFWKVG